MQKINLTTIVFTLLAAMLFLGCEKDKEPIDTGPDIPIVNISGIPDNGIGFLYYEETSKSFTIESDAPWEITKTDGWFSISPYTGKAGTTDVKIYVTANYDEIRNGEFTVIANSGGVSKPCNWSQTYQVSQSAYLSADILITGLSENEITFSADDTKPLTFDLFTTYAWNITLTDDADWLTVSPRSGIGAQSVTITVAPKVNTDAKPRECMITITTSDPQNPNNTDIITIPVYQSPHYEWDTNLAVGAVLFNEDFDWIIPNWDPANPKYGWPTAQSGLTNVPGYTGTADGVYNEISFTIAPFSTEMTSRGWTFSAYSYARAEGWAKLGRTNDIGWITTPAMTAIAAGKTANLLVSFDAAIYASAAGNRDTGTTGGALPVIIEGDGTINNTDEKRINIPMLSHFGFDKYYFIVHNASASTKIKFGDNETGTTVRFLLDNIKIVRANNINPALPATESVVIPPAHEVKDLTLSTAFNSGNVVAQGATLRYFIWVNKAWTATPSANWLRFTQVWSGTAAAGGSVTEGRGAATATALQYNNCLIVVDPNTTASARTATITVISGGQTLETITVKQEASSEFFTLTGIDDRITLSANNPPAVQFTVNASSAWNITTIMKATKL